MPDYRGPVCLDYYGRPHPVHSGGTARLREPSHHYPAIRRALLEQFDLRTDHRLLYRRLGISAEDVLPDDGSFQLDLFTDYAAMEREERIQMAMLEIRNRFGKNAVVKGMNLMEGATAMERNLQIGGHRA